MKQKKYFNIQINALNKAAGLVNTLIKQLTFDLHIPGHHYCGPGTKLSRLTRNDLGINPLDEACKVHDIAYATSSLLENRHKTDKILEKVASQRLATGDARIGEKMAALGVKGTMKFKRKLGMELKKNTQPKTRKGGALTKVQKISKKKRVSIPRKGGFLPFLLPLLGALGAVEGGSATIAKAVADAKTRSQQLEEEKITLQWKVSKGKVFI